MYTMDKAMGEGVDLTEDEDKRMSAMIHKLQFRDSLKVYNAISEQCFNDCVNTFWRSRLNEQEDTCVRNCAAKYLKFSMLVGDQYLKLQQQLEKPE